MELHNVTQGSAEWLALRSQYFTASEAPAMMGASPYMTRSQLLAQKHTGLVAEVDGATQRRFDAGHETEAAYRPMAEVLLGDELYPVTGSIEVDGLRLLASFDGLTMDRKTGFEHKLYNKALAESIIQNGEPGPAYYWQMEQQLLVSGGDQILFVTSNGDAEDEVHCFYQSKSERRAALIAGWKQFAEDLKAYVPPAASAVEKIVAEPVESLPAPVVQVTGQIALVDNFKAFEERLREFLATKLIREPKTDEDFVNLDAQIKQMKSAREALKAAESQMLAQVQPVDQAKKTKDMLDKMLQQNVSMAEKIMEAEKDRRKGEIVAVGVSGLKAHIEALNKRLGVPYMPTILADFGGAIKGLKSLTSMEDKVSTELARAKIAASEVADKIELNLKWLGQHAADYAGLFADRATLVLKPHDDFVAQAQLRISNEKQRVQAEHDRIREEGAAKARQDLLNEQASRQLAAVAAAPTPAAPAPAAPAPAAFTSVAATPIRVNPVPAAANDGAVINVGEINSRLAGGLLVAPLSVTAAGLQELGFAPVPRKGAGVFFRESDYPRMCEALIQHLTQVADLQVA